jgi:dihydropteroate synthase
VPSRRINLLPKPPRKLSAKATLYLWPRDLLVGADARETIAGGRGAQLASLPMSFSGLRVLARDEESLVAWDIGQTEFRAWRETLRHTQAERLHLIWNGLSLPRPDWAGIPLDAPVLMGIVNVTPDSYSDGGRSFAPDAAAQAVQRLWADGACIADLGAESTRPGSEPISEKEELSRIVPVLDRLSAAKRPEGALLSVDTRRASVMRAAVAAGAQIINDTASLGDDNDAAAVAAQSGASIVLMHRQGEPRTMNVAPDYDHVLLDVFDFLDARIKACEEAGIPRKRIAIDPGFGFGKRGRHNAALLRGLPLLQGLGCPILVGLSRKSFSRAMEERYPPEARLPGTIASLILALERGAQILRVHDVGEVYQAVQAWQTINETEIDQI